MNMDKIKIVDINALNGIVNARRIANSIEGLRKAKIDDIGDNSDIGQHITVRYSADRFEFNEEDCKLISQMMEGVDYFSASLLIRRGDIALNFSVNKKTREM